jgi:hypothetical protein
MKEPNPVGVTTRVVCFGYRVKEREMGKRLLIF